MSIDSNVLEYMDWDDGDAMDIDDTDDGFMDICNAYK